MRLLSGLSAVLAVLTLRVVAADQPSSLNLSEAITRIPKCALPCLLTVVGDFGCDPLDKTCVCETNYDEIVKNATPCVLKACTFPESLQTKNLTALACDAPVRDKTARYNVMAIVLSIITNILVTVRLVFNRFFSYRHALGWDDYAIIGAMLVGIPAAGINVAGLTANGMGRDTWTLPVAEIKRFGAFFYTIEVLYLANITFIKLSLSAFYLYIFPGTWTRHLLWATIVFNAVSGIVFVVVGIAQCVPISFFWLRYTDPGASGHCLDINAIGWSHAAVSIAVDVWLIAIPISQLPKLQLHWKKKIAVTVMFLLGTFVTVVSILRLHSLIYLARSINPTWDHWIVAWWSTIEINVGMICASLPTLRLVLVRMWPRAFSTHTSRNKSLTRPNSASYIVRTKELTQTSSEIELGAVISPETRRVITCPGRITASDT